MAASADAAVPPSARSSHACGSTGPCRSGGATHVGRAAAPVGCCAGITCIDARQRRCGSGAAKPPVLTQSDVAPPGGGGGRPTGWTSRRRRGRAAAMQPRSGPGSIPAAPGCDGKKARCRCASSSTAGMLLESVIVHGSGKAALDEEAEAILRRASPYPRARLWNCPAIASNLPCRSFSRCRCDSSPGRVRARVYWPVCELRRLAQLLSICSRIARAAASASPTAIASWMRLCAAWVSRTCATLSRPA